MIYHTVIEAGAHSPAGIKIIIVLLVIYIQKHRLTECVSGLVVKFLLAMQKPRVRFPADASLIFF